VFLPCNADFKHSIVDEMQSEEFIGHDKLVAQNRKVLYPLPVVDKIDILPKISVKLNYIPFDGIFHLQVVHRTLCIGSLTFYH
jgi:hypothetical protein